MSNYQDVTGNFFVTQFFPRNNAPIDMFMAPLDEQLNVFNIWDWKVCEKRHRINRNIEYSTLYFLHILVVRSFYRVVLFMVS